MKTENKSREVEEFAVIKCPKCNKVNICKISIEEKLSFYTGSFSCTACEETINVVAEALDREKSKAYVDEINKQL